MTKLTPCNSCRRHCRINETSCPFCGVRRMAMGVGALAIATLAIACDAPAANTPHDNVVIPQSSASSSPTDVVATIDAGAAGAPIATTPAPPDTHRAAPMYGMPPMGPGTTR